MSSEIWKDVKGYEGLYSVSNYGVVKRLGGFVTCRTNTHFVNEHIMQARDNGKGYLRVKLSLNDKAKRVMLHRIIAEAFIDNPKNLKTVNHINGIKNDNRIENLEWCTQSENVLHAFNTGLKQRKYNGRFNLKVTCTVTGKTYNSIAELSRLENLDRSHIAGKLNGRIKNNTSYKLAV